METTYKIGVLGCDALTGDLARALAGHNTSVALAPVAGDGQPDALDFSAHGIYLAKDASQLVAALDLPRVIILRAASGLSLQAAFAEVLALLGPDDIIVDASDSWHAESMLRAQAAGAKEVQYLAMGIAANENGAAPLLMLGGRRDIFQEVVPLLLGAAPQIFFGRGAGYMGEGPSGHVVGMAHAAIENTVTEIVRECRGLLERGLGAEAGDLLRTPNDDPLFEYLHAADAVPRERASVVLASLAVRTGHDLGIPMLATESATGMRCCENRAALADSFCQPHGAPGTGGECLVQQTYAAMRVAMIIAYTEGLALLVTTSERLGFMMDAPEALRVWRSGTHRRAALLDDIQAAFHTTSGLPNLLFDDDFSEQVMDLQEHLRQSVWQADEWNIPTPALAGALRYIDTFRDAWMPVNLVQPEGVKWTLGHERANTPIPALEDFEDHPSTDQPIV